MIRTLFSRVLALIVVIILTMSVPALGDMQKGDKGPSVADAQRKLISMGYLSGSADGSFGPKTENAVKAFQQAEGLNPTGIIDYATEQRLDNPTVATPFDKQSKLEATQPFESNGVGNDGKTTWRLDLNIPMQRWMGDTLPNVKLSWTNTPVADNTEDATLGTVWENAKRGQTCYRCLSWDNVIYYELYLPDDPSLEGRRWMQIDFPQRSAIVYFDLKYKSDYISGSGWRLSNVTFEDLGVTQPTPTATPAPIPVDWLATLEAVAAVEDGGIGNEGNTVWRLDLVIPQQSWMGSEELPNISMSWSGTAVEDNSATLQKAWDGAKQGRTCYRRFVYQNSVCCEIYLPDVPSIAGAQWMRIDFANQSAIIHFNLAYNGSYDNGGGWSLNGITFENAY